MGSAVGSFNSMWAGNPLFGSAQKAAQAEIAANIAKSKAEEAFWRRGGSLNQSLNTSSSSGGSGGSGSSLPSYLSGYGDQRSYDDAQRNNRLQEAQSALSLRKDETQYNSDVGDRSYQNRTNTDVGAFNQKQATMEAIAQRQKAVNTDQAAQMWKSRDS